MERRGSSDFPGVLEVSRYGTVGKRDWMQRIPLSPPLVVWKDRCTAKGGGTGARSDSMSSSGRLWYVARGRGQEEEEKKKETGQFTEA